MPIYDWRCSNETCNEEVQVSRSMSDFEKAPDGPCPKCQGTGFIRFIAQWRPEQTQLIHGGKAPWFQETLIGRVNNGR